MNENTKHIVASNLTMAYCQAPFVHADKRPRQLGMHDDPVEVVISDVYAVYQRFVALLESEETSEVDSTGT
jgi:hypothetical protein